MGLCFFAARGRQRESVVLCFSHSSSACPKPLPWSQVSLTFPLCLALCPRSPHSFRSLWGSLGCSSHQRLFYCLAPHLKDPQRQHQLGHPSPSISAAPLTGGGKGIFSQSHHDTSCSPRCPHTCPWHFTQHPSHPSWAQGDGETAGAPCCPSSLGWEDTSLLWASPSTALAASTFPGSPRRRCSVCFSNLELLSDLSL